VKMRRDNLRTREDLKRAELHWRICGFDDGYAGRPARSLDAVYQESWRLGREAREAEGVMP
jgi:hypothetical protein